MSSIFTSLVCLAHYISSVDWYVFPTLKKKTFLELNIIVIWGTFSCGSVTTQTCWHPSRCYEDRLKWGMAFIWYVCKLTLLLGCVSSLCVCLKWSEHSRTHFKPSGGHGNPTWSEKVDLQSFNCSVPVSPADESQPPVLRQLLAFNSFIHPSVYPCTFPFQCI